jgi:hypothetical protein
MTPATTRARRASDGAIDDTGGPFRICNRLRIAVADGTDKRQHDGPDRRGIIRSTTAFVEKP